MTRDEFIEVYLTTKFGADRKRVERTPDGFKFKFHDGHVSERVAVPCACDYDLCQGWRMIMPKEDGE